MRPTSAKLPSVSLDGSGTGGGPVCQNHLVLSMRLGMGLYGDHLSSSTFLFLLGF